MRFVGGVKQANAVHTAEQEDRHVTSFQIVRDLHNKELIESWTFKGLKVPSRSCESRSPNGCGGLFLLMGCIGDYLACLACNM